MALGNHRLELRTRLVHSMLHEIQQKLQMLPFEAVLRFSLVLLELVPLPGTM